MARGYHGSIRDQRTRRIKRARAWRRFVRSIRAGAR